MKYKTSSQLWLSAGLACLTLVFIVLPRPAALAQKKDKQFDSTYHHKNNIKLNLSPYILYTDALMFAYERSVNKRQSFSVSGGILKFPEFNVLNISNTKFQNTLNASGFNIGADYRFYLAKENKYTAPHGVYIGPYVSYFDFNNSRSGIFTDTVGAQSNFTLSSNISWFNIGFQLGYQFVLWDRFSIDLTFAAPSLTSYNINLNLDGNIDPSHAGMINTELAQKIRDHFPMLDKLLSDKDLNFSGTEHVRSSIWSAGFKYSVYIGYRFGK